MSSNNKFQRSRNGKVCMTNHTTFTSEASQLAQILSRQSEVKKVSPAAIKSIGASRRRIKFHEHQSCLKIDVIGSGAVQSLVVVLKDATDRAQLKTAIQSAWDQAYPP